MKSDEIKSEKSLSELFEQLAALKKEVAGIGEDVVVTLEQKWSQFHSVLFPHLVAYGENWNLAGANVFKVQLGHLVPIPALSQNMKEWPAKISLNADMSVIQEMLGDNSAQILKRSMASREMEIDFEMRLACAPFCLFDSVVGLFFFEFAQVDESNYERLCSSTEKFFDKLRREILVGRISELKKSAKQAG